ncbi:MAG: 50S ribosomal protein L15 [Chloroflexi bacterium]|nr:50S ribosomal protein L15 [Chloroflexota bacterium]
MRQNQIAPVKGARHKRKRVGRGDGSGHGSYSTAGCKGQQARSGKPFKPGFEGGQLPIVKRLPQLGGFVNIFRKEYSVVNVGRLSQFPAQSEVTPEVMLEAGLIDNLRNPIKVLGGGEIAHALTISAHRFSSSAEQKIAGAGGKVNKLEG